MIEHAKFERRARNCQANREEASAELNTLSRWLIASLMAINGAGVIAAANASQAVDGLELSAGAFTAGIVAALLNACINQHYTRRMIQPLSDRAAYWDDLAKGMEVDHVGAERAMHAQEALEQIEARSILGPAAGWLSGIMFIVACLSMAGAIRSDRDHSRSECGALRSAMLSDRPDHGEARETFIALGCAR